MPLILAESYYEYMTGEHRKKVLDTFKDLTEMRQNMGSLSAQKELLEDRLSEIEGDSASAPIALILSLFFSPKASDLLTSRSMSSIRLVENAMSSCAACNFCLTERAFSVNNLASPLLCSIPTS